MLIRIVRMSFREEEVPHFEALFESTKQKIRGFAGCRHLELWQDLDQPNIFMTYSLWESAEALEKYRQSTLFRETWAKTKGLFKDRPFAYSSRLAAKTMSQQPTSDT